MRLRKIKKCLHFLDLNLRFWEKLAFSDKILAEQSFLKHVVLRSTSYTSASLMTWSNLSSSEAWTLHTANLRVMVSGSRTSFLYLWHLVPHSSRWHSCLIPLDDTSCLIPPDDTSCLIPPDDTSCLIPLDDTSCLIPPDDTSCLIPPDETSWLRQWTKCILIWINSGWEFLCIQWKKNKKIFYFTYF